MSYDGYELLRIELKDRVATATVDAPPINVMTLSLFGEIARFGQLIQGQAKRLAPPADHRADLVRASHHGRNNYAIA